MLQLIKSVFEKQINCFNYAFPFVSVGKIDLIKYINPKLKLD